MTALDFNRDGPWRLSVQETSGTSSILIAVSTGFASSEERIQFHCARGSAVEYMGTASARVECTAVQAGATIDVQISDPYDSQFILEFDENGQNINNAGYVALGGNFGSPRPYMNYVAIMTNANIDVRTIAGGGATIFEVLGAGPQTLLLNQLKVGNHDRVEVRGTAIAPATQSCRGIWYNRR